MSCKACRSVNLRELTAEMNIHSFYPAGINEPSVWGFPLLLVCMDCGFAEFQLPEAALRELKGLFGVAMAA